MKLFVAVGVLCLVGVALGQPLKAGYRRPEGPAQRPEVRRRNGAPQRFQGDLSDPELVRFSPREPFDNPSADAPRPRPYKKTNPFSAPQPSDFRPRDTLPQAGQAQLPKLKRKSAPEAAALKQERPEFSNFRPERPEPANFRQERPEPPAFRQERPEAPAFRQERPEAPAPRKERPVPSSFRPEEDKIEPVKDSSAAATGRQNYDEQSEATAPESRDYADAGYDAFGHAKFEQGVVNYAKGLDAEKGIPDGRMQFSINGQQGPNSYRFGYDTGYGANRVFRIEEKDAYGIVHGRYGYYDSNGKLRIVNYTAHPEHGFSAEGNFGPK